MKTRFLLPATAAAGFAAGWLCRPQAVLKNHPAEARTTAGEGLRSHPPGSEPKASSLPAGSGKARTAPFPRGEARSWLQSLTGLDYLKSQAGEDALSETLASFDAQDFKDLQSAVLEELKDPSRLSRQRKFAARLLWVAWPLWIGKDPEAALSSMSLAAQIDPDLLEDDTVAKVFRRFASKDPQAAAAALAGFPKHRLGDAATGIVLAAAQKDGPFAALETAKRLGIPVDATLFVDSAMERDPARAAALTAGLSGDAPRDNAFRQVMEQWSKADPAAAAAWMDAYQGPGRTTGMTAVLARRLVTDPQGAAAAFLKLENAAENPYTPGLAGWISQSLLNRSGPEDALAWLEKLAPNLQEAAVSGTVKEWAQKDAESASRWLSSHAAGPVRDAGTVALIGSIAATNPAEAWQWAQSLSVQETRGEALRNVLGEWQRTDAAAARSALEALDPPLPGLKP